MRVACTLEIHESSSTLFIYKQLLNRHYVNIHLQYTYILYWNLPIENYRQFFLTFKRFCLTKIMCFDSTTISITIKKVLQLSINLFLEFDFFFDNTVIFFQRNHFQRKGNWTNSTKLLLPHRFLIAKFWRESERENVITQILFHGQS